MEDAAHERPRLAVRVPSAICGACQRRFPNAQPQGWRAVEVWLLSICGKHPEVGSCFETLRQYGARAAFFLCWCCRRSASLLCVFIHTRG
eukprot:4657763-Prymnesium_polylepis.1